MPTIRDVARIAGVSISTVSLTLNHPDRVSVETKRKVVEAARAVRYTANPIAQSLKRGRSRLIAMVVTDITNPFFGNLLQEIERCAMEADHLVVVSDTTGLEMNEKAILNHLSGQLVSGVILQPCGHYLGSADHIASLDMPCVLFDHKLTEIESDFVGTDNVLASAMLTEHLIRLGHTRIGYIGGTAGLYTAERRRQGFLDSMKASGLTVNEALVVDGRYSGARGYEAAMRLMTLGTDRPTALLVASNVMALGALQACNDLAIACPEEVSIAGIDDVPWSSVIRPRLTMAVQPVEEMARVASGMLMARIAAADPHSIPVKDVILTPRLVIGQSTRAPAPSRAHI
jgi:LacI family transcriptional regulator